MRHGPTFFGDEIDSTAHAAWQRVGVVPKHALMPTGERCATFYFFKQR